MKHVLVGKFSHGRPPIDFIKDFFVALKLKGSPMRMFKWTPEFTPLKESLLSPLGSASICVALDVSKPVKNETWIVFEDDKSEKIVEGFWHHVDYDSIPHYCNVCSHLGHTNDECKRKGEEIAKEGNKERHKSVKPQEKLSDGLLCLNLEPT
ncbi:hypothetical protein LIER_07783 [Lithospermum erythrorhizon]|uniref:DUF4283 domain-containing protein n=1 Tax=Lithospermum erythrorhizon TaxID=34254 RepID=A0AAV3PBI4_LITER